MSGYILQGFHKAGKQDKLLVKQYVDSNLKIIFNIL